MMEITIKLRKLSLIFRMSRIITSKKKLCMTKRFNKSKIRLLPMVLVLSLTVQPTIKLQLQDSFRPLVVKDPSLREV